jgi:hypothetical protein
MATSLPEAYGMHRAEFEFDCTPLRRIKLLINYSGMRALKMQLPYDNSSTFFPRKLAAGS